MIKRQRSDIPCFQLMFRNKPLHSPHATLEDYQITRDQMIKCIPLHSTGPNEADKMKHEKRMQQADLLIQELKGRVTSLNNSLNEMKTKIDSTKSMSALQEIRSVLELQMKAKVFEARKPDKVDSLKSSLVHCNQNFMEEVRKKSKEIEDAYHDLLQNTQHDETLKDHFQKKKESLQKEFEFSEWILSLQLIDKLDIYDARDEQWHIATIAKINKQENSTNYSIHYDGWSTKW